jgi:hypothetical protein
VGLGGSIGAIFRKNYFGVAVIHPEQCQAIGKTLPQADFMLSILGKTPAVKMPL